jgi:hypothetical protein
MGHPFFMIRNLTLSEAYRKAGDIVCVPDGNCYFFDKQWFSEFL